MKNNNKHKWAAMEGIVFKSFKIKAILEHLKWEMIVDTERSHG